MTKLEILLENLKNYQELIKSTTEDIIEELQNEISKNTF